MEYVKLPKMFLNPQDAIDHKKIQRFRGDALKEAMLKRTKPMKRYIHRPTSLRVYLSETVDS